MENKEYCVAGWNTEINPCNNNRGWTRLHACKNEYGHKGRHSCDCGRGRANSPGSVEVNDPWED